MLESMETLWTENEHWPQCSYPDHTLALRSHKPAGVGGLAAGHPHDAGVCAGYFVQLLVSSKFWSPRKPLGDTASQEGSHEPLGLNLESTLQSPHRTGSHGHWRTLAEEGH